MRTENLRNEVKRVQDGVVSSAHKMWLAGLGTVSRMEDQGADLFNRLVERGRGLESRGIDGVKKARGRIGATLEDMLGGVSGAVDRQLAGALHRFGVPTRNEVRTLSQRIEALSSQLGSLEEVAAAPAEPAGVAKAAQPTVYHVAPHEDGWKVEAEGTGRAASVHGTKDDALAAARDLAKAGEPSQVVVHRMDGTIQTRTSYGEAETA